MFEKFFRSAQDNLGFLLVVLLTAAAIIVVAYLGERLAYRISGEKRQSMNGTIVITVCGMLSAIAAVLMLWEVPVGFAPSFYKLDFSDIPALIAGVCFGPVAGSIVEFVKIILKVLVVKPTSTAFVGEYANFVVGCALIVPAAIIYQCRRSLKNMIIGGVVGTLVMATFGTFMNAVYFLPKFAELYGMPLDSIIAMGTKVNSSINSVFTFVFFAVAPLNLLKGGIALAFMVLCYRGITIAVRVVWNR